MDTLNKQLFKIIEKLATINTLFDEYYKDRDLLYKELCLIEDKLVKLKNKYGDVK